MHIIVKMAAYGQDSTSSGTFSLEMGDFDQTLDKSLSQKHTGDKLYTPSHDEFQFMHGSTVRGNCLQVFRET